MSGRITDVAVLPRWIRVGQLLDYVAGVHPRFDRAKCERFLAGTQLKPQMRDEIIWVPGPWT